MRTGRNHPCPCGSGRKYKACCMARDLARARMEAVVGREAFRAAEAEWLSIARATPVWEADVVPVEIRVRNDPDAALALVMVTAGEYIVHGAGRERRPAGAGERARMVADAVHDAGRAVGVFPKRLQVRDAALARAVAEELAPLGVAVEAAPLPALDAALDGALEHLAGNPVLARMTVPAAWAETEAGPDVLADFHRAAAEFHAAAPWETMDGGNALVLAFPDGVEWGACVMGAGGMEYGLAMYPDPRDLTAHLESDFDPSLEAFVEIRQGSLTASFDPAEKLTRAMRREHAKAGWVVDDPAAYPRLFGMRLPERRVTAAHVHRATLALRAVARLAAECDPEPETGVRASPLPVERGPGIVVLN